MKILHIKTLRGPNYWSNYRKQLIEVKLDLEELEAKPSNQIPGFPERLLAALPSIYEHRCSEGKPGGFLERVEQGTWMGHIIEHIALELQSLAGMECGFGRTRSTHKIGVYHVVYEYLVDKAGVYAAHAAVALAEALCNGKEYDVQKDIAELIRIKFSESASQKKYISPKIPVVAVTGTNGKTTTTRLIAFMAALAGKKVGYTCTDGIYINGQLHTIGDCSGPASAETVLKHPEINFAVLECARGGILRSGLAFDRCDVGIVTNVAADHLGMDEIETLRDLARVKCVVPRAVKEKGYAILNADDDHVYRMRKEVDGKIALFSTDPDNERIKKHTDRGGMAAFIEDDYFVLSVSNDKTRIARVKEVPLTGEGRVSCMIKNILPAILTAAACGMDISTVKDALKKFIPGPELTPGRMNIFSFPRYQVMVDYVHNIHGFQELENFLESVTTAEKIGIITAPGDRKNEDIIETGRMAARLFDRVIIRHDKDMRGRDKNELNNLIIQGIKDHNPEQPFELVSQELDALRHAMQTATDGAFIVLSSEYPREAIDFLVGKQKHGSQSYSMNTFQKKERSGDAA